MIAVYLSIGVIFSHVLTFWDAIDEPLDFLSVICLWPIILAAITIPSVTDVLLVSLYRYMEFLKGRGT